MRRPDLQPVGPFRELPDLRVERPRAGLHGAFHVRRALEQVRPADVADEDEVPRGGGDRLGRMRLIRHEKRQMLGRMARRVHHVERHVADLDPIAMLHQRRLLIAGKPVLPARVALVGEKQRRAGFRPQFAAARQKVGVNVRLSYVRHPRVLSARRVDVLIDVAIRIDDDRFTGDAATDQIAGLGEFRLEEPLDEHA